MKVLITGACGNAGLAVSELFHKEGVEVRMADVNAPPNSLLSCGDFMRCDTRTSEDVRRAVAGMDAVVHLAAWHCALRPRVSDATIFAVNVDGTFNVLEACRAEGIKAFVYASSMAYGWGSVYSATKVVGEELCRAFHHMSGASVVILRYHEFVPGPYLEYGTRLLRNGVDRSDVAGATLAALRSTVERKVELFNTIVHTNHGMPPEVIEDFRRLGPGWCESQLPGAKALIAKYALPLPEQVEHHDLAEARQHLAWEPQVSFMDFLGDLMGRDKRREEVHDIWVPGGLPGA